MTSVQMFYAGSSYPESPILCNTDWSDLYSEYRKACIAISGKCAVDFEAFKSTMPSVLLSPFDIVPKASSMHDLVLNINETGLSTTEIAIIIYRLKALRILADGTIVKSSVSSQI
jgi:hypothetical protein